MSLIPVVDELVYILRANISEYEYHNISTTISPIKKTELLIDAIYTRNDKKLYCKFCKAVEVTKFEKLSKELWSNLN